MAREAAVLNVQPSNSRVPSPTSGESSFYRPDSRGRPVTSGGGNWQWSAADDYQADVPITATLAVRRLMPCAPGTPVGRRAHLDHIDGRVRNSLAEPSRRIQTADAASLRRVHTAAAGPSSQGLMQGSRSDGFLIGRSVSSTSSRKSPQASAPSTLFRMAPAAQQQPSLGIGLNNDLQELARESILWLDEQPKQERASSLKEMKTWVKEEGLDWDLWWQYCQRARQEAGSRRSPTGGPMTRQARFNPVPSQMRGYNGTGKARPTVSKAQSRAIVNTQCESQVQPGQRRPTADEEWHSLALEALDWLNQVPDAEKQSAKTQMRQWVVQMGLSWDHWWSYCRRIQGLPEREDFGRQNQVPLPLQRFESDELASQQPSFFAGDADPEASAEGFPAGFVVDQETLAQMEKDRIEAEKALKKKRREEKQAREAARRAKHEEWEASSKERLLAEYRDNWRTAVRGYTTELLSDADGKVHLA